jgi:hypothetical protein
MKRRKAISSILFAGTASAIGFGGYEWYSLKKSPDRNYLQSKKSLLAELAETIIPATSTPGAKEAGAVEFMLPILNECTDKKTLNRFIDGLKSLETYTFEQYSRTFEDCNTAEKEIILSHFQEKTNSSNTIFDKIKIRYTGKPFFNTLKTYTVYCYCISEKGATMGMRYIAVPGKNFPCIPLEPNQKAWATK